MTNKTSKHKKYIAGMDIGTTKVCVIIASYSSAADLEIIGVGSHPCLGLAKGAVVHMDKTVQAIRTALEEAQEKARVTISKVCLGIAGNHIYSFNNTGVVAIKNQEISPYDINRAFEAAKNVAIPEEREVLHVLPLDYKVDNLTGIKNPLGMSGARLEVKVHIVTGVKNLIQNFVKCVERTGKEVDEINLQPLCSSMAVLSEEEKEVGVVLVDIGGGTTDLAFWKKGHIIHSQIIPVGGNHFTNDLAVAFRIPHSEAEKIKIDYGNVIPSCLNTESQISLQGLPGTRPREVKLISVAEVLNARAEELLETIRGITEEKGLANEIVGGFVLTGGGSLVKSFSELAEFILERPTKIGFPIPINGMTSLMQNPKYSTCLGLLMESKRKLNERERKDDVGFRKIDLVGRMAESLRNVFREIF